MHDDIKQFLTLRETLNEELQAIDSQIVEEETELKTLKDRRRELHKVFQVRSITDAVSKRKQTAKKAATPARKSAFKPDKNVDTLVNYLTNNPGADRENIRSAFNGSDMDVKKLSLLLSKCSKRGLIVNIGTRRQPSWTLSKK